MKILIVEDDKNIIAAIECTFNLGWPEVEISATDWGKEGVKRVETEAPELLILDLGLPDIDGLEVIKEIRLFSKIPILVLSVKTDETTVVRALNLGANDFVYKPFRPMELLARIKRLIMSSEHRIDTSSYIWGKYVFDYERRELTCEKEKISLSGIEAEILNILIKNSPDVVTHLTLARAVWGEEYEGAYDCLKVHIRHLREKIEKQPEKPKIIITKIGAGYYVTKPN